MAVISFPGEGNGREGKARAPRSAEMREQLKRLIILGELRPNAPLLELELAARFQCSQGSVREALLALQEEGLVRRSPHRGTRVSECTEAEAAEMFRLRHAIETRGMARAFRRIDAVRLAELKTLIRQMETAAAEGDEYGLSEFDRSFHRRILEAADLPALDPILHRCLVHNHRFKITESGAARDLANTARRHWTIVEAIESGDRDAAVRAISHHVATIVDLGPDLFSDMGDDMNDTSAAEPSVPAKPSAEMQAVLDRLAREDAGLPDPTTIPAVEGRALAERKNRRWQVDQPPMAESLARTVPADAGLGTPDIPVAVFRPAGAKPGTIFFIHGGGFAYGSNRTHERFMRLLASLSGHAVVGADYRLAPEDPFPAGLDDAVAVGRFLATDPSALGLESGPVVVAGDSAGANLALATLLRAGAAGGPAAAGGLLFYGCYAPDFDTPSYRTYATGFGLTTAMMRRYWDWYTPDEARRADPFAAPLLAGDAALAALPPLHLVVAECDPLASDTHVLKRRLDALGRHDVLDAVPGVVHGFLQMTPALAAARTSVASAASAAARFIDQANQKGGRTNA